MFAGVGERTREGNDLYKEMIQSGVISTSKRTGMRLWVSGARACERDADLPFLLCAFSELNGESKAALVYGQVSLKRLPATRLSRVLLAWRTLLLPSVHGRPRLTSFPGGSRGLSSFVCFCCLSCVSDV